jgi:hypothetical protein
MRPRSCESRADAKDDSSIEDDPMGKKRIRMAIAYDFDGTLSPGNMQEYNFIPALGLQPNGFWKKVKQNAKEHNADEYLYI